MVSTRLDAPRPPSWSVPGGSQLLLDGLAVTDGGHRLGVRSDEIVDADDLGIAQELVEELHAVGETRERRVLRSRSTAVALGEGHRGSREQQVVVAGCDGHLGIGRAGVDDGLLGGARGAGRRRPGHGR